jgi:hypothetical protein
MKGQSNEGAIGAIGAGAIGVGRKIPGKIFSEKGVCRT